MAKTLEAQRQSAAAPTTTCCTAISPHRSLHPRSPNLERARPYQAPLGGPSERALRLLTDGIPGAVFRYQRRSDGSDAFSFVSSRIRELAYLVPAELEADGGETWVRVSAIPPGVRGPVRGRAGCAASAGLRVMFMSGYSHEAVATQGTLSPGAAFLQKPFSVEELVGRLGEVLDRAGW